MDIDKIKFKLPEKPFPPCERNVTNFKPMMNKNNKLKENSNETLKNITNNNKHNFNIKMENIASRQNSNFEPIINRNNKQNSNFEALLKNNYKHNFEETIKIVTKKQNSNDELMMDSKQKQNSIEAMKSNTDKWTNSNFETMMIKNNYKQNSNYEAMMNIINKSNSINEYSNCIKEIFGIQNINSNLTDNEKIQVCTNKATSSMTNFMSLNDNNMKPVNNPFKVWPYSYYAPQIKPEEEETSTPRVLDNVLNKLNGKEKIVTTNTENLVGSMARTNDFQLPNLIRNYKNENSNVISQKIFPAMSPLCLENGTDYTNMLGDPTKKVRVFHCLQCTKSFRHKSSLKQHCISIHEHSKYKCQICLKEFNRISSLNTHRSIHDVEKKFKCGHCGKAFHQKGNLKHHIFTHVSIRPYVCKRCNKSFHQPSNLRTHLCIYEMMDPLPLAVILHEGDGLADLNFQLDMDLHQGGPFNYSNAGFGQFERNTAIEELSNQRPLSAPVEYDVICYCFNCNVGFTHKMDPSHYEYERSGRCPLCDQTLQRRVIPKCDNIFVPPITGPYLEQQESYQKTQQMFANFYNEKVL
ncbi:hypothetical protein WDU94_001133 [Cyamophila willieti]